MLPIIRVHSFIRAADDQYNSQALKDREKQREAQTDRDLAGFYVYQNYLKRLRRLHRNYVKKYAALQQQQPLRHNPLPSQQQLQQRDKQSLFLPNSHLKHLTASSSFSDPTSNRCTPMTRFRLPAGIQSAQPINSARCVTFDQPESSFASLPPIASANSSPTPAGDGRFSVVEEANEEGEIDSEDEVEEEQEVVAMEGGRPNLMEGGDGSKELPIYIPCGRESSALRQELLEKKHRQGQGRSKNGALNFRMWRSVQGLSGTPYSS